MSKLSNLKVSNSDVDTLSRIRMKEGVYRDLPIESYHQSPGYSKTSLCQIDKAPIYLKTKVPQKSTKSLNIGTAFHEAMEGVFKDKYVVHPDPGVNKTTKSWKDFVKRYPKHMPLKRSEYDQVLAMYDAARSYRPFQKYHLSRGFYESSFYWHDAVTNSLIKCRPDYITPDGMSVIDFKTTVDPSPKGFQYQAYKYHYYVSAALTLEGIEAVTGIRPKEYLFLAVSNSAPYLTALYRASEKEIALGDHFIRRSLLTLKTCLESGKWPGLQEEILELGLPFSGLKELREEQEVEDEFMELVG
ncbi:exodeoxyribonuclease VIII [Pseudobacteriovorax antillogorgiicola]|uniref:Exodeoxyribonuclease VIII n=1 Tax=Pseudobacteriovorax antillogorgiicola TaxID=1513793 RepID=A0A1Y6CQ16_9BACT|nr:exodeoxyribonuclease VIII [Pseudobacteriovorax antillogorgiicola]SMF80507.1 exodeoxyribonuclease VIII [Pseudobacteriovorax antillogorgiicola]